MDSREEDVYKNAKYKGIIENVNHIVKIKLWFESWSLSRADKV